MFSLGDKSFVSRNSKNLQIRLAVNGSKGDSVNERKTEKVLPLAQTVRGAILPHSLKTLGNVRNKPISLRKAQSWSGAKQLHANVKSDIGHKVT